MNKQNKLLELSELAFRSGTVKKLIFSRPISSEIKKISGRTCSHRGKTILALEYSLPGDTVSHKNVDAEHFCEVIGELIPQYSQVNLLTTAGDVEYKISRSGQQVLLGADKLERRFSLADRSFETAIESLDNVKSYILRGDEPFLHALGISDRNGRVHDKRQGKFRQINRFLEYLDGVYEELPEDGELIVYDLCCGKSYLSFAVYFFLTNMKGRTVRLLGIDLKRDVIAWCSQTASALGFNGMSFVCDDIRNTPLGEVPHMVVSLHACDIATDVVIDRAIELGASVILSTPCCHRYLNDKLAADKLAFVSRHPHLRNKLCEVLTDGIRVARLEAAGYSVTATELTDPDNTPKNTLIRAIKAREGNDGARAEYERILEFVLGSDKENYLKELR